ncbi:hypothetical protein SLEP1_g26834 [Rubroshorea leprosula]|uniref:Uncharacterized protein n=1 Tax=Rubroshorea leprosula TaxID=152421 RepID=A0AAV5JR92_9ROSI|nr:hypothetical protein SLEP1_g26834 [Rubroshorea leprosula]
MGIETGIEWSTRSESDGKVDDDGRMEASSSSVRGESGEEIPSEIEIHGFWILYRAKQDGPVVLGWRHPWEGHDDHGHGSEH